MARKWRDFSNGFPAAAPANDFQQVQPAVRSSSRVHMTARKRARVDERTQRDVDLAEEAEDIEIEVIADSEEEAEIDLKMKMLKLQLRIPNKLLAK